MGSSILFREISTVQITRISLIPHCFMGIFRMSYRQICHAALFCCLFFQRSLAQDAGSLKTLAWKKFAQEISKDADFQKSVKAALPGLEDAKRTAVNKSISHMIDGKGYEATGTGIDGMVIKALRAKGHQFAVDDQASALDAMSDEELLQMLNGTDAKGSGSVEASVIPKSGTAVIALALDPARTLNAPLAGGEAVVAKNGVKFKLVPGLSNPDCYSFEPMRSKGLYLRHKNWKMYVEKRPSDPLFQTNFDQDATFKIVPTTGDKVQLEAAHRPGEVIAISEDGNFILAKSRDNLETTSFKLIDK